MPIMDALDLCRRPRADIATREVGVVIVTGDASEQAQAALDAVPGNPALARFCSRRFGCCSPDARDQASAAYLVGLVSGLPKQVVRTSETAECGRRLAGGLGRAPEIRKLTAPLALEGGEPAVRRPLERATADRTENGRDSPLSKLSTAFLPRMGTL